MYVSHINLFSKHRLAMPAALHRQLYAIMPSDNFEMNFNLLFTVSYFPNMILPLFGGAIVDRYGEAKCLVTFCCIVLLGQALTALGVSWTDWKFMLLGRLVFGLGAQNLIVANASLISKWFVGTEGVALGLSNVSSYAGVILTNIVSPRLANTVSPPFAFWLGVGIETIAIALALGVVVIDWNKTMPTDDMTLVCSPMFSPIAYRHYSAQTTQTTLIPSPGVTFSRGTRIETNTSKGKLRDFKPTFWFLCISFLLIYGVVWSFTNVSSAILLERNFFLETPPHCLPTHPDLCTSGSLLPKHGNPSFNSEGKQCPVRDNCAPAIPRSLNVTVDDASFDYSQYIFPSLSYSDIQCHDNFWAQGCTMNYCQDQDSATEKAGIYMSIPYFFTVALTFHLGLLVDRTGWRTEMICFGSVLLVLAHVLLALPRSSPPMVPLVTQGLGYTICVAALWPSVPFTVKEESVGTAFGIMMAVQNVGLAIIPLVVAYLYRLGNNHYIPSVEVFFAICSFLAVIVGFALMFSDRKTDHVLGTPKADIRLYEKTKAQVPLKHGRERANSDAILLEKGILPSRSVA